MTKVFYTWLGPQQSASREINGIAGMHRPDLFGILQTARASFRNTPSPTFTLCVLKKFQAAFDAELPDNVKTLAVDDVFSSSSFNSLLLSSPNVEDLDVSVDYIMRETLRVRGTGYSDSVLPFKKLAFVKDLWSLYSVWKYGGYHLDSGIFPAPGAASLNFPEPKTFCVPTIDSGNYRGPARRVRFRFRTGKAQSVTISNKQSMLERTAMAGKVDVSNSDSHVNRLLDVWLMGSPAGDPSARLALETYIRTWFEIQAWAKENQKECPDELMRELIVFAALTGVTHTGEAHVPATKHEVDERIIDGANKVVRSMNLKKVGFRTHR